MRITIYSPDRHFVYDGRSLDKEGIGGGLTARIRIAAGLAKQGHAVTVICNCAARVKVDGVEYIPLEPPVPIDSDVLVMHSSGGAFDLSPLRTLPIRAKARILAVSGAGLPIGSEELQIDAVYACSNFIREALWQFPFLDRRRIFVTHYGVNSWNRPGLLHPPRDPHRMIYSSHPSKGMEASLATLRALRALDPRFTLWCYGGERLWGGADQAPPMETGLHYGGSITQKKLASEYLKSNFLLQLQTREEPFGITVAEAMAAGCLVVASRVGAFAETIQHGWNGFLIDGNPDDPRTIARAAGVIHQLSTLPELTNQIRQRAIQTPFDWSTIAQTWAAHFEILLGSSAQRGDAAEWARCLECGGAMWVLPDGYHCRSCGFFNRVAAPESDLSTAPL